MSALDFSGLVDSIASAAAATGLFESVNQHEPTNAPGNGITAAVWIQTIDPVRQVSGLNSTAGRLGFLVRLYSAATQTLTDQLDPAMMAGVHALFLAYSGAFTLGGEVMEVDLLGAYGVGLSGKAGWLNQSGASLRVYDITLPLIIDDLWDQAA
jgi:hypothetical protein